MASKIAVWALIAIAFVFAVTAQNTATSGLTPVRNNRGRVLYYVVPNNRVLRPIRPIPVRNNRGNIVYYQMSTPENRGLVAISANVLVNIRPIPVVNQRGQEVCQAIPRPGNNGLLIVNTNDLLRIQLEINAQVNALGIVDVNADVNVGLQLRSIQDSWKKLKEKLSVVINKVKIEFEKILKKSGVHYEKIMDNLSIMKKIGQELLDKAHQSVKEFLAHGKSAYVDFMGLYDNVKEAYNNVKPDAKELVNELKEVVSELKKTAIKGQLLVEIKKNN